MEQLCRTTRRHATIWCALLRFRFWSFEILFVATPSVMFVIYSAHKAKVKKVSEKKKVRVSSDNDDKAASEKNASITKLASFKSGSRSDKRNRSNVEKYNEESEKEDRFPTRQSKTSLISMDKHQQWRKVNAPWVESDPAYPKCTLIKLKGSNESINHLDQGYLDNNDFKYKTKGSPRESVSRFLVNRNLLRNDYYVADNLNNNNSVHEPLFVWRKPTIKQEKEGANDVRGIANPMTWPPQQDEGLMDCQPNQSNEASFQNEYKPTNLKAKKFTGCPGSPFAQFPPAPPGYPGLDENPHQVQNAGAWNAMPRKVSLSSSGKHKKPKSPEKIDKEIALDLKPAVAAILMAEHFRWYVANVFLRLCLEAGFAYLQLLLFGLHVPELYKCQRWPCPNVVDCFISRPTEKTIFLWFMFIYSCICVMLNVVEIIYLFYAYVSEKIAIQKQRRKRLKKQRKLLKERLNYKVSKDKTNGENGLLPNDKRHQMVMVEESLSSWSSKHNHGRAKHWQNSRDARASGRFFNTDGRKEQASQDFIAILLDSEQNESDDIDIARAEEDDINDFDDFNAINYNEMAMGMDNDDGGDQGADDV